MKSSNKPFKSLALNKYMENAEKGTDKAIAKYRAQVNKQIREVNKRLSDLEKTGTDRYDNSAYNTIQNFIRRLYPNTNRKRLRTITKDVLNINEINTVALETDSFLHKKWSTPGGVDDTLRKREETFLKKGFTFQRMDEEGNETGEVDEELRDEFFRILHSDEVVKLRRYRESSGETIELVYESLVAGKLTPNELIDTIKDLSAGNDVYMRDVLEKMGFNPDKPETRKQYSRNSSSDTKTTTKTGREFRQWRYRKKKDN